MIDTVELCRHIYDESNELTEDQKDIAWAAVCESMDLEDDVNEELFYEEISWETDAKGRKALIEFFENEGVI